MVKNYLEKDFGTLLAEFSDGVQSFEEGSILKGIVISIDDKVVGIDIGSKSIGYIPISEFKDENIKINDVVDVLLNKIENKKGELLISHENAKKIQTWNNLKQYITDATTIEGKILGKVKGGFAIDVNSVIAFLPKSQIDPGDLSNIAGLIGQKEKFVVLKVDDARGNVVVSKRAILDEVRNKEKVEILSKIQIGDTLEGVVKNLTDYGAFIDFGSFDGLLHLTDISWCRIRHPSDVLKVGESVKVQVIKYDAEAKKVSLGMKQLQENPWTTITEKYPTGKVTKGKVTSIAQYGVFVEIDNGIEGLVHISEISWFKNNLSPAKILSVGQEINVMVLEIDTEHHRISLGIKQTTENPWKIFADKHEVGDILDGVVKNSTEFGLFVELEGGLDALLHISDLEFEDDIKKYNKGDKIQVVLLSTDYEQERIAVGIKQLKINLKEEVKKYEKGVDVKAIVKIVKKDLLEVESEITGLKALIKKSYISKDKKEQKTDKFKVSEIVEGKVYIFDTKTGKFEISLKPLNEIVESEDKEDVFVDQYTGDEIKKDTLGSIFGNLFDKIK
ncbi:MAG: 30S ribosomal protein S1 [Rickettsiales bacterium]|jgi:small subunit ribosomal protein S1|nr:30S ribosomal protein S1 [Rickettsiales bacterium]